MEDCNKPGLLLLTVLICLQVAVGGRTQSRLLHLLGLWIAHVMWLPLCLRQGECTGEKVRLTHQVFRPCSS